VYFITTCNSELLAFSASAVELAESASIGLGTALDCGHWSKWLCLPAPHRDGVCCGWMRATWVVVLFVSCWGHAVTTWLLMHFVRSMATVCMCDIVRWSHLWYHLIDMITKYVVYSLPSRLHWAIPQFALIMLCLQEVYLLIYLFLFVFDGLMSEEWRLENPTETPITRSGFHAQ